MGIMHVQLRKAQQINLMFIYSYTITVWIPIPIDESGSPMDYKLLYLYALCAS